MGERKERERREATIAAWTPRLGLVKEGTVSTKSGIKPMSVALVIADNTVGGNYSYKVGSKNYRGILGGTLGVEKSNDAAKVTALKISVGWTQDGLTGKGYWKTSAQNAQDIERIEDLRWPDHLVPDKVVIEGAWGVSTEDGGGTWTVTVPGRSARAGTSIGRKEIRRSRRR